MCQIIVPVPDNRPDINRVLSVAAPSTSDDIFVFPASTPMRRDVYCVWRIFFFFAVCEMPARLYYGYMVAADCGCGLFVLLFARVRSLHL